MWLRLCAIACLGTAIGCGESGIKALISGSGINAALNTVEQNPVVMLELQPAMLVQVSDVIYDPFGDINSYDVTVIDASAAQSVIKVRQSPFAQTAKPAEYSAELHGKPLPMLDAVGSASRIGFSLKELGGAVLPNSGSAQSNVKSEVVNDSLGRPYLKRQTFTHEGRAYDLGYSGQTYDPHGRLTGYQVDVQTAR